MTGTRRKAALGLAALMSMGILGFVNVAAAEGESTAPTDKVTFTIGATTDMKTANPFKSAGGSEYEMFFLNYDMLYNFSQDTLEPESALAEYPPDQSADGKTWTFKIRSGVTWSDGEPLTAADIAFTYNLINEKGLGAFRSELGDPIDKNAFEAPNDTTLIWHMQTATLAPLAPPWVPIVPEHIWGKFAAPQYTSKDIKEFRNVPAVGSGPFHLTEWREGQFWQMETNPDYWMGAANIDEVIFRVYGNPEALSLALTTGEIDAAESLPPSIFNTLQDEPNIQTNIASAGCFEDLAFNFEGTGDPSLRDEAVRDAIAVAINRESMVDRVALGYASAGTTFVLPSFARYHWEPPANEVQSYDPQAAKDLLDSAGYLDVDGDGLRETPDGQPWQLEVLTISDYVYSVPEGKLIVGWMNDVGIDTTIKTVSEGQAFDLWGDQDFDMYVWSWGPSPDPDFISSIFTTDQCLSWSDGCYSDPAYDKLYEEQRAATEFADRQAVMTKMQQYVYDKNPLIVLNYQSSLQAYRTDRFTGFVKQPQPQGYIFYGYGPVSYLNIKPVSATDGGTSGSSTGVPTGVLVGLGAAMIFAGAAATMWRRKGRADTE